MQKAFLPKSLSPVAGISHTKSVLQAKLRISRALEFAHQKCVCHHTIIDASFRSHFIFHFN